MDESVVVFGERMDKPAEAYACMRIDELAFGNYAAMLRVHDAVGQRPPKKRRGSSTAPQISLPGLPFIHVSKENLPPLR